MFECIRGLNSGATTLQMQHAQFESAFDALAMGVRMGIFHLFKTVERQLNGGSFSIVRVTCDNGLF